MKSRFLKYILLILCVLPVMVKGQSKPGDYKIQKAYYSEGDSTTSLTDWVEKGLNVHFVPARDSMIISVDIGGRDKVFFMGMAVKMDNPGFITTSSTAEFYHWIFISHFKESVRNAYVMREYIEGSLEKTGRKNYFIQVALSDQSEFQFYGTGQ
ncbi:MAG TPA: hypothetical protein PL123_02935 [Bacteroidales bacterium]|nr:hypothetical protein [Bacteroidales bacterium]